MIAWRFVFAVIPVLPLTVGCSGSTDPAKPTPTGAAVSGGESGVTSESGGASLFGDSLDKAYQDMIANEEEFGRLLAAIHNKADAERAIARLQRVYDERNGIYKRLGEFGAEYPPAGIPPKFREQYKAAKDFQDSVNERLAKNPEAVAINEVLMTALGDEVHNPIREKPFRLGAELRRHGKQNIVHIELRNREGLVGPQHQKMAQMLQETAGARHAEALIEDDGTYYLVLAPVSDMQALIGKINIGSVSDVNANERKFALDLDPTKIPSEPIAQNAPIGGPHGGGRFPAGQAIPGGSPGFSPSAGSPGGSEMNEQEKIRIENMRRTFAGAHGRDGIIEFLLMNARDLGGPRMGKVAGVLGKAVGGRMLQPVSLQSGGVFVFFQSSADVNQVAAALDLGPVEDIDVPGRRIVVNLDAAKVPQ